MNSKALILGLVPLAIISLQTDRLHAESLSYESNLTLASRYIWRGFT